MSTVGLSKAEKDVPNVIVDTGLDAVSHKDPESALQSSDNAGARQSAFFKPSVGGMYSYTRPRHFKAKKVGRVVSTKNGVFAPTLGGTHFVSNRTQGLVRRGGAEGHVLPIDGLRLDQSSLLLPVTRIDS